MQHTSCPLGLIHAVRARELSGSSADMRGECGARLTLRKIYLRAWLAVVYQRREDDEDVLGRPLWHEISTME